MRCDYFLSGLCQSCGWIEKSYDEQIHDKQSTLNALLAQCGDVAFFPFSKSQENGFRNKAKMVVMGYAHEPVLGIVGVDDKPQSLVDCPLYLPNMQKVLADLPSLIKKYGVAPYQVDKRKGELKFVLLTQSLATGEMMLRFVARSELSMVRLKSLAEELAHKFPSIAVISVNIQPIHMAVLEGEEEFFFTQKRYIEESFNGIPLAIRPKSFFQTNPVVAASLYRVAAEWVSQLSPKHIWDLFCGVGGFGLHCLTPDVQLTGIEIEAEAIACAKSSAQKLGFDAQVTFNALDARNLNAASDNLPDVIIVNPPRRGIGDHLCKLINKSAVKYLLYSSCNPSSLVEDINSMPNYRLVQVQGFDMFPHTDHFEVLALLECGLTK